MSKPFILITEHHAACGDAWLSGFRWGAGVTVVMAIAGAGALFFI